VHFLCGLNVRLKQKRPRWHKVCMINNAKETERTHLLLKVWGLHHIFQRFQVLPWCIKKVEMPWKNSELPCVVLCGEGVLPQEAQQTQWSLFSWTMSLPLLTWLSNFNSPFFLEFLSGQTVLLVKMFLFVQGTITPAGEEPPKFIFKSWDPLAIQLAELACRCK